jgi:V/A-type H+-transporting ATPase subunit D
MAEDIAPTRSAELMLKERVEMAEDGHDILEKKRDGLIHEFMEIVGDAKKVNKELCVNYSEAKESLEQAKIFEGKTSLLGNAMSQHREVKLESTTTNIMGVVVPEIQSTSIESNVLDREYGLYSSSSHLDEAVTKHEQLIEKVVEAAEVQTKVQKLLEEIKKTKRRVNALEHNTIPMLKNQLDYVSQTLEEEEREETFRMKKVKEMANED